MATPNYGQYYGTVSIRRISVSELTGRLCFPGLARLEEAAIVVRWFEGANKSSNSDPEMHTDRAAPQMGHLCRGPFDVLSAESLLHPQWVVPDPVEAGEAATKFWAVSDWDVTCARDLGFHLWEAAEEDTQRRGAAVSVQAAFRGWRARR